MLLEAAWRAGIVDKYGRPLKLYKDLCGSRCVLTPWCCVLLCSPPGQRISTGSGVPHNGDCVFMPLKAAQKGPPMGVACPQLELAP